MTTSTGEKKRYRIVSDGTPHGTEIFDPDGNRLDDVERVQIDISFKKFEAKLTQIIRDFEYEGPAEIVPGSHWPPERIVCSYCHSTIDGQNQFVQVGDRRMHDGCYKLWRKNPDDPA